jgi:hypothetical protein
MTQNRKPAIPPLDERSAEPVPGFLLNGHELLILLRYWVDVYLDRWVVRKLIWYAMRASSPDPVERFAAERCEAIQTAIGDSGACQAIVDEVTEEYSPL